MSEPNVEVRNLYSEEILAGINRRRRNRWLVLALVVVPLLAVLVFSLVRRMEWLSMVSASLIGIFAVFWIDLFVMPVLRYRNLVVTALTGRSHTQTLVFSRVDPDPSMVDGVSCYALTFLGEPDKHGSREQLYYLDRSFPLPELVPGQEYILRYSGRTIIGIG